MSDATGPVVPVEIVSAALRAAERTHAAVGDVSLLAIAEEAGISRSTLVRRLGGTRKALDNAVRAAGVDPGGKAPVRDRAVQAAAELISSQGLAATTLEAIATRAECSIHSLYATFGGRDALLRAVYDRYAPIVDLEAIALDPDADLRDTVVKIYRLVARTLSREPRVVPAMLAEGLARPATGAAQSLVGHAATKMLSAVGRWLDREIAAGRIRDLPPPLLFQQMIAPIAIHTMIRPALGAIPEVNLPDLDDCCAMFADAFIRAVAVEDISSEPATGGKKV